MSCYLQCLLWPPYDLHVCVVHPFICQKCGMCCDKIGAYRGRGWGVPCQYLTSENLCSIYENRPDECAGFPLCTDLGDQKIGCPGRKRVWKLMSKVSRGIPRNNIPICERNLEELKNKLKRRSTYTPKKYWNKIWPKIANHLTPEEEKLYLELNYVE